MVSPEVLEICTPQLIATEEYSLRRQEIATGQAQALGGKVAVESFLLAIELANKGDLDAIVTGPLNKEAMHLAGYNYPGHTEILAEQTGTTDYAMLFVSAKLNVILTTIHCSFAEVLKQLTSDKLVKTIKLGHQAMQKLGISSPRIAVAGLNPHAGEGGLFGEEDDRIIAPVIKRFRAEGMSIDGPLPPDTVFRSALDGRYDLVVAQYHDQGLIPLKLVAFDQAVNITVGTPIIRTSPDHGTAYDIVGKGIASADSLIEAIKVAVRLTNASI